MRIGKSNATHGQSKTEYYQKWTALIRACRLKGIALPVEALDYATFRAHNQIPREVLAGTHEVTAAILDPSKPVTIDNVGWKLRPRKF